MHTPPGRGRPGVSAAKGAGTRRPARGRGSRRRGHRAPPKYRSSPGRRDGARARASYPHLESRHPRGILFGPILLFGIVRRVLWRRLGARRPHGVPRRHRFRFPGGFRPPNPWKGMSPGRVRGGAGRPMPRLSRKPFPGWRATPGRSACSCSRSVRIVPGGAPSARGRTSGGRPAPGCATGPRPAGGRVGAGPSRPSVPGS
jgi:hypothetical protein